MYGYFTDRKYSGDFPHTDLAMERRKADTAIPGMDYSKEKALFGSWERLKVTTKIAAESIGKPIGIYSTFCTDRMDMLDCAAIENAKDQLAREICMLLEQGDVFPEKVLVAGLGNPNLAPDSIGCLAAARVKPTMHISERDSNLFDSLRCASIAVCTPNVMSNSGLSAAVTIRGICDIIKPDAVIAIDALATRSPTRIGSTLQICNTGICPGSGIGNHSIAIGEETLGVPVIAIGLPTVIDARMLCPEGSIDGNTITNMLVCPKEINDIVNSASEIIGDGINRALGVLL